MWSLRESEPVILSQLELTLGRVGGGGSKSKDRKGKLRAKNERLNEQRKRRNQEEIKQKKLPKDDFLLPNIDMTIDYKMHSLMDGFS